MTSEITTLNLILRPFKISDAQKMFTNWANSKSVCKYLSWQPHKNILETESIITSWVGRYNEPNFYQWCIVEKESNEPIGSISVLRTFDKDKRAEIGYALGEKWWGKGYTTEALIGVIEYLFSNSEYLVICAKHDTENIASGKVMQKSGMKFIKQIKGGGKNNIHPVCDVNYYEIKKISKNQTETKTD